MLSPDGAGFRVLDGLDVEVQVEVLDIEVVEVLDAEVVEVLDVDVDVAVLDVLEEVDGVGGTTLSSKLPPKSNWAPSA